jgi:SNF2 family DNA or RNA helicase
MTRPELTKSLAYRLLAMDVGYSSDEGGDEDTAYFIDGLDETFTSMADIPETMVEPSRKPVIGNSSALISDEKDDACDDEQTTLPMRSTDFSTLGSRGKLLAAVALATRPPDVDDFDNFPLASSKRLEEEKREQERQIEQQRELEAAADIEEAEDSPSKSAKKSTVKVEQVSVATNEPIHVWANAEMAAATLQISLSEIKSVLRGDYNEDLGDEVGGFRWRYALASATVTAPVGGTESKRNKKSKESWLEFRDRLYDPASPHIYKNGNRLRDYQVEGVNWLASTYYRKQGCVLADGKFASLNLVLDTLSCSNFFWFTCRQTEMGLGKVCFDTRGSVDFLSHF